MSSIFSNLTNQLNQLNLLGGGQNPMPAGFVGPQQLPVQGPPMPSIGQQVQQNYQKLSDQPGFNSALFKLGTTLMAARENGMGLGQGLLAGQSAFSGELDRAKKEQAAKSKAALDLLKYQTDSVFKLNNANLDQQKFDFEKKKFAVNPGTPSELQAAQKIMSDNPGMNFTDAYLTTKNGMLMGAGQSAGTPGDLSSLAPAKASQVKALAEGRMAFPTGAALKSPYWQEMLSSVSQYDPNFDTVNYNARSATRKAFTSGKEAAAINSLNTAIGHLGELKDAADKLHNTSYPALNSIRNTVNKARGKDNVTNFERVRNSVAPELVKVYRGSGGAEADIQTTMADFNPDSSPPQLNGSLQKTAELLQSKIDALNEQYSKGMGIAANAGNFITPKSQKTLQKLGVINGMSPNAAPGQTTGGIKFLGFEK